VQSSCRQNLRNKWVVNWGKHFELLAIYLLSYISTSEVKRVVKKKRDAVPKRETLAEVDGGGASGVLPYLKKTLEVIRRRGRWCPHVEQRRRVRQPLSWWRVKRVSTAASASPCIRVRAAQI
jgi:hypothetical protein